MNYDSYRVASRTLRRAGQFIPEGYGCTFVSIRNPTQEPRKAALAYAVGVLVRFQRGGG